MRFCDSCCRVHGSRGGCLHRKRLLLGRGLLIHLKYIFFVVHGIVCPADDLIHPAYVCSVLLYMSTCVITSLSPLFFFVSPEYDTQEMQ